MDGRTEGRKEKRKIKHGFVVPLIHTFTCCPLYVPWLKTEPQPWCRVEERVGNAPTNSARARSDFLKAA